MITESIQNPELDPISNESEENDQSDLYDGDDCAVYGNKTESILDDIYEEDESEDDEDYIDTDSEVDEEDRTEENEECTQSDTDNLDEGSDCYENDIHNEIKSLASENMINDAQRCFLKRDNSNFVDFNRQKEIAKTKETADGLNKFSENLLQKGDGELYPDYISVLGPETFSKSAQEPWIKNIKLYQPLEIEQILLPDNANCLAVQAFLRMCHLEYQVVTRANAEAMSPTGKVPFIKCGPFVVSELEGIIQFVNNRGLTLTNKLDKEAKSDMRAYMCLVHNILEKAELYICWLDPKTYNEITSVRHGSIYPWPLNVIQNWSKRKSVIRNLKVWNWYHKKLDQVFQEIKNACQALSDRLDQKKYFFGSCTELDALVFGHVYSLCSSCFRQKELHNILIKFDNLIRHSVRIGEMLNKDVKIFDNLLSQGMDYSEE